VISVSVVSVVSVLSGGGGGQISVVAMSGAFVLVALMVVAPCFSRN